MSPTVLESPGFAGVLKAVNPTNEWEKPAHAEVAEDVEGEQETLAMPADTDDPADIDELELVENKSLVDGFSWLQSTLQDASKGVTEGTHNEYKRFDLSTNHSASKTDPCMCSQMNRCAAFLIKQGLINKEEEFFTEVPHPQSPWFICAWIMHE
jgi:hypothetical protein